MPGGGDDLGISRDRMAEATRERGLKPAAELIKVELRTYEAYKSRSCVADRMKFGSS